MSAEKKPLIRPRNVLLALGAVLVLALGSYAYFLANMGGYLPWQEDPTPISNDITPFAGEGFENLPTTPPRRTPTSEPTSAATPAASPASSPVTSPESSPEAGTGPSLADVALGSIHHSEVLAA